MAATVANISPILKNLYPQKEVAAIVYKDHPLLGMLKKDETFTGQVRVCAVRYADGQGRSQDFAAAQAAGRLDPAGTFRSAAFLLTRVRDYQLVTMGTEAILASQGDKGALISLVETEVDAGLNNIAKSLAQAVYGDGFGVLGTVGVGTASPITLANPDDVVNFEVGQSLQFAPTVNGVLRGGGPAIITGINRDTGVITYSETISGLAVGDVIFNVGDNSTAPTVRTRLAGLQAWLPATAPGGSDNFFGVNRSVEVTRLAGLRLDLTAESPEDGLLSLSARVARDGGRVSHVFMNPIKWSQYAKSMGSKVEYETFSVGEVGFTGLKFMGPKGPVALIADQDCPFARGFGLSLDTWTLASLKPAPFIQDMDGNRMSREAAADRYEVRISAFAQLECRAPGYNATCLLP